MTMVKTLQKGGDRERRNLADTVPLAMAKIIDAALEAEKQQAAQPEGMPITAMPVQRPPLKVFLIEDSPFVRERVIEKLGATGRIKIVGFADTEDSAIEKLRDVRCDAIILDLSLRQGTGFHVLRTLRASGANGADTPYIIVFTDYAQPYFRDQTMELGADYFLDKAKDFDRLWRILDRLSRPDDPSPAV